jgi:hypothetical protein
MLPLRAYKDTSCPPFVVAWSFLRLYLSEDWEATYSWYLLIGKEFALLPWRPT